MGTASCAVWKSLLKHEREEENQELRGLNPAQSPKPPSHFCHFCFLFSKHLGCTCIIFLNFPPEPQRWEIPFLQNRLFCGQQYQYVFSRGPFPPRTLHPPPLCRCQQAGGLQAARPGWGCALLLPTRVAVQHLRTELGASVWLSSSEPATNFLETCENVITEI